MFKINPWDIAWVNKAQHKYSLTDYQVNKPWLINVMEYHRAIRRANRCYTHQRGEYRMYDAK